MRGRGRGEAGESNQQHPCRGARRHREGHLAREGEEDMAEEEEEEEEENGERDRDGETPRGSRLRSLAWGRTTPPPRKTRTSRGSPQNMCT